MRHVCLRNPFPLYIPFGNSMLHRLCVRCNCRKQPVLCREAEGLATELWSPRFVTMQWLCSRLCYVTAANQRKCVEIELLATVSWKWGCRPFSCRCSQNVPHCRKEICSTCSFKESIPTIPCVNSKHPIPARSLRFFLRAAACSTSSALWLHHAHPFVVTAGKACLMQRSTGFGRGVVVSKICYNAVIVLSELCYVTAANQRTIVEIELSATVSWKWGCRPFSCRCSQNVPHCRKEICSTCSFKESIPTIPCVNSKHPIPARSLRFFLRAAACSTSSALWLHHAHPFVVTAEKAFLMQRSGAASLSATYVPKMWRAAKKRWNRHLCLRNPCFCGNLSLHSV